LHGLEGEAPSVGVELLGDVKAAFDAKKATKLFSAELLEYLIADEEAPWSTWNRGKPMSPRHPYELLCQKGALVNQHRNTLSAQSAPSRGSD